MQIELIRHGITAFHEPKRYQGRSDIPLSAEGAAALQETGRPLARVYVSPLTRARQTASILFPDAEQISVPGLEEMDFGDFEGRLVSELEQDPAYRAWVESGCLAPCPGGESRDRFADRVCTAFVRLLEDAFARGENELVIVAHGGTLMSIMDRCVLPRKSYFAWHRPCGGGYLLDARNWKTDQTLQLIRETNYSR